MKKKILIALLSLLAIFACAFALSACGEKHTHRFAAEWSCDPEYHWHAATCEHDYLKEDLEPHFDADDNGKCDKCKYTMRTPEEPEKIFKTVHFDLNYNTHNQIADKQFEVGRPMADLPTPVRDGYTFICWRDIMQTDYTSATVMPNADLDLFAVWEKKISQYSDEYVSFKPATDGWKDYSIYLEYADEVDEFVYVEITSDDLGGVENVGQQNNFNLQKIDGMEYAVNPGYIWMWYQGDFETLNGAQRFTLFYGDNIQFVTVSNSNGVVQKTYLVDIYVKHDYYISLYKSLIETEPYKKVRVIENDRFPSDTAICDSDFEFDKRVYYNNSTDKYEEFVYSTAITKDWNLYQTYKPVTIETELNGGTLDGDLAIVPYTKWFTLPSPQKDDYDFLGWQDESGKYLTNVEGYSGEHYISEKYLPEKLTAVYEKQNYYYDFDGTTLKTYRTVPVVTYTDSTMETILQITYSVLGEYCALPTAVPEEENGYFSYWLNYSKLSNGTFSKTLTDYNFDNKITAPLALVPEISSYSGNIIPINAQKTYSRTGTYYFYLPAAEEYSITVTTANSVAYSLQPAGASGESSYTATSASPSVKTVYCYKYNQGSQVKIPGRVTLKVTSCTGDFTVLIKGATATAEEAHKEIIPEQLIAPGEKFSISYRYVAHLFNGWYSGSQKISDDLNHEFEMTQATEYTAKWISDPEFEPFTYTFTDTTITITGLKSDTTTTVVIPKTATHIATDAFKNKTKIKSVTIGNSVTTIGKDAFYGCTSLESITVDGGNQNYSSQEGILYNKTKTQIVIVPKAIKGDITIPNRVTEIGDNAFSGCGLLTSIEIPDSVISISSKALYDCDSLTSVTLPFVGNGSDKTHFGYIFGASTYSVNKNYVPTSLKTVIITGGTTIGGGAFYDCTSLESVTIPDGVTYIGSEAFYYCNSLESVTIPDSVTKIGSGAFSHCTKLTSVTLPFVGNGSDKTHFGYIFGASTYSDNKNYVPTSLKTVIITGGTTIGGGAFYGCTSLTSVTIPDSVTSIGREAFRGCTSLTSVTIPDSVTTIGGYAFEDCTSLTGVYITDWAAWCKIEFNGYNSNPLYYAHNLYLNNNLVTDITADMLQGVPTIGSNAFSGCALTSIEIPDSVTSIGDWAFYHCTSLLSVTIPDGVTEIGWSAFSGCTSLTNVTIGSGVTEIGSYAFEDCTKLTSIKIPDSVTTIGERAFDNCHKLVEVYNLSSLPITAGSNDYGYVGYYALNVYNSLDIPSKLDKRDDGYVFCTDGEEIYLVGYNGNETALQLPANYNGRNYKINNYAFYKNTQITSVIIPDSVTSIGREAFRGCTSLTSVTIGSGVTEIGSRAFRYCTALTSITIPDSVTSIGEYAFSDCTSLLSVTIPDGVTTIGEGAFYKCTKLTSVTLPFVGNGSDKTHFGYIFGASTHSDNSEYIPKSLETVIITGGTTIGSHAFYNCTSLTSIVIPDSVTTIGIGAFNGCYSLESIEIPDSVTSISNSAFWYCTSLTSVTIGSGVKTIGEEAFYNCTSLTSVTFANTTGWKISKNSDMSNSQSAPDLSNPTQNAEYLKRTYCAYYWKRG